MRQVTVTANAEGDTDPVVLDQYLTPFNVTYGTDGAGDIEVSITDPYPVENQDFVEATFEWLAIDPAYPNGGNYLGLPVRAIRLSSATQGTTFTVIQAGVK